MNNKDGAIAFLEHLEKTAESALFEEYVMTLEEKGQLSRAMINLRPAFDRLAADQKFSDIWQILVSAFVIGSRATISDSVEAAVKAPFKEGGAMGGKKSGKVRRENRKWISEATARLKDAFAKNKGLSQDGYVTEIQASWKSETIGCPGSTTLKKFVAEELAKKVSEAPSCS